MTTLPALLLGGAPGPEPEATFAAWEEAMTIPNVRGLVVGRALLYPPDGDVAGAIARAARIVRPEASGWLTCTGRAGTLAAGPDPVALGPEAAGWAYCGLRVLHLAEGEQRAIDTGEDEVAVLPLSATGLAVDAGGQHFDLDGRASVFSRVSDFAYVGRDTVLTLTASAAG